MKKIATFILLCLLAFNWFGYRLVVSYMQQRNDVMLEVKLNTNSYDEAQLVELKIPMNLPYQNNWTCYERVDGEVEYKGIYYKYVKRKVANDTLYLQCISNTGKATLETAKNDFFKNSNDISQQSTKQGHSKKGIVKNVKNDFDCFLYANDANNCFSSAGKYLGDGYVQVHLPNPSMQSLGQPPDTSC